MASLSVLKIGDKWRAQVKAAGRKSTSKSFPTKKEADQWGRQMLAVMEGEPMPAAASREILIRQIIADYRRLRVELGAPVDPVSNQHYMLLHLEEDLGGETPATLTPARLLSWAKMRREQGAGGYTVNMELSQLGTVMRHVASFKQLTLPDVVGAARPLLHYAQLISGGARRTRRPSEDEGSALVDYLRKTSPVMADAVLVAGITGMRRGEIVRIAWSDIDPQKRAILVRQRKHPRRTERRDDWVPLLGESWDIVMRQPRNEEDDRIFPLHAQTLTKAVTAAVRALNIPDLRLHDFRHGAASTLRDLGFQREERKAILGHTNDRVHDGYVHVDLETLHAKYNAIQDTSRRPTRPRKARGRQT